MTDSRNILSTIVQSSVVELFRGVGIAVAPLPKGFAAPMSTQGCVSAAISYSSPSMTGTLNLHVPQPLLAQAMLSETVTLKGADLTREFSNQLLGRIKNRLLTYQIVLRLGLPTNAAPNLAPPRRDDKQVYLEYFFQSLRGLVYVTLRGTVDYAAINYAGSYSTATEGDIILF
jgi:hypothetical protein